jgi:putative ubiquitin-RnfH superfamily antitoxin RatB of RatAB toxin-antitoxin module
MAPGQLHRETLELCVGSCVQEAVRACQLRHRPLCPPLLGPEGQLLWAVGIWGRRVHHTTQLCDGDRLELLRPLTIDPKTARRLRFETQGRRTTGLFRRRLPLHSPSLSGKTPCA